MQAMLALLRTFSWQDLRHHPWRSAAAVAAVLLGVALAFAVHVINASALDEFSQAVRAVNGQPDLELRAMQGPLPEALYAQLANHPQYAELNRVYAFGRGKVKQGEVLIAPGDRHLLLRRLPSGYRANVVTGPYVSRHRPSVDVLMRSAAIAAGPNAMGIILTGMGDDGARCLGELQAAGGVTVAQDEASSVVYGMPREAVRITVPTSGPYWEPAPPNSTQRSSPVRSYEKPSRGASAPVNFLRWPSRPPSTTRSTA